MPIEGQLMRLVSVPETKARLTLNKNYILCEWKFVQKSPQLFDVRVIDDYGFSVWLPCNCFKFIE